jgi:hypothetical protein
MPTTITTAVASVQNATAQDLFTLGTTTTIPAVQPATVVVANTAGGFTSNYFNSYNVDDTVTLSGTLSGNATATITGYSDPTTYYVTTTDGFYNFVLSATQRGANITTTAGTTTGLSFTASGTAFPAVAGAEFRSTVTSPQSVTFDTVLTDLGTDITFTSGGSNFVLSGAANIAYNLTASVDLSGQPGVPAPATYGWVNVASGAVIGTLVPVGTPVSTTFLNTTAANVTVAVRVFAADDADFAYPAQVVNASATVTEVSGYSVA